MWDHPRVCGEHSKYLSSMYGGRGSSPRMRGTQKTTANTHHTSGIIPAYAGNTSTCRPSYVGRRDHPRVCGEHIIAGVRRNGATGSSPRMRGTRDKTNVPQLCSGIIPAYAGNTANLRSPSLTKRDHPRVCGEHLLDGQPKKTELGSSPRMRGTPSHHAGLGHGGGIIPAYAGNTHRL